MKRALTTVAVAALFVGLVGRDLSGQSLPPVNLGLTSFVDGILPAGPGFYYQQYLQYYRADEFEDSSGDKLGVPKQPDLTVWLSLNQFIYQSDQKVLLGGKWGLDVIVPLVSTDLESGSLPITDNGAGLGDVLVGPFLQWGPIMVDQRPFLVHRIEAQMIFPTGKYDSDHEINPGSGFFSFDPYWSGTVFFAPKWEASWRAHYLWNAENDSPSDLLFPGAGDTRAGQAIHVNFAASHELLEKRLRIGANGYFLKQITDSEVDGDSVSGSKEQVLGIGPGLLYSFSANDHVFCNLYFETLTENRPEGIRAVLHWAHHF